jgi:hypothetical protein
MRDEEGMRDDGFFLVPGTIVVVLFVVALFLVSLA